MTELTQTEANTLIAEMQGLSTIKIHGKGVFISNCAFNPYKDIAQAVKAMEVFGGLRHIRPSLYGDNIYDCEIVRNSVGFRGTNESLSVAITTALCSAIKGKQVTIKED